MSISATLANALTGLNAASRSAQVVSTNVANATTEGYARREIELSARTIGGYGSGVQVDGLVRVIDETVLRERRLAAAAAGETDVAAAFYDDLLSAIGQPDEQSSLSARVVAFESALLEATSRPDSDARLAGVLVAATALTTKLNDVSDRTQSLRVDADNEIAENVSRLNTKLAQIDDLNGQILRARALDREYPALLDQRQRLIDDISDLVPIRQLRRDNDTVALYSLKGALLLDVEPAVFGFLPTEPIAADMTFTSGALSGLTINGNPVNTSGGNGAIAGGRLAGLFDLRDVLSVTAQSDLDEIARDLIARFEDPSLDATLNVGDPGLFTDGGARLDLTDLVGLADRIAVNALADPARGGATWRLRDGLGAAAPGPVGDATLLTAMMDRMQEARPPSGGSFSSAARSGANLAASLTSIVAQALEGSNDRLSFENARLVGLDDSLLSQGVDTDQEMQKLILIEQAYAANVRVIRTADELIQQLIGL